MTISVYGVQLIASPGSNRGARSGLIQALKGVPPFGVGGDFPRMPLNKLPVSDPDIAFIQNWIDHDCQRFDPRPTRFLFCILT